LSAAVWCWAAGTVQSESGHGSRSMAPRQAITRASTSVGAYHSGVREAKWSARFIPAPSGCQTPVARRRRASNGAAPETACRSYSCTRRTHGLPGDQRSCLVGCDAVPGHLAPDHHRAPLARLILATATAIGDVEHHDGVAIPRAGHPPSRAVGVARSGNTKVRCVPLAGSSRSRTVKRFPAFDLKVRSGVAPSSSRTATSA